MKKKYRNKLKKIKILKLLIVVLRIFKNKYSVFAKMQLLIVFFTDYRNYKRRNSNNNFILKTEDLYPRIYDKTTITHVDPVYFYQDTWCAKKIFENKPKHHYDVGSQVEMIGIISQFTPTTMIDIRPLKVSLPNLSFVEGSILNLPFKDGEIASLSSMCVIEHIGLGRYGDPLDQFGSEKSAKEFIRVLATGGSLYISVPVDNKNRTYFNAHRAFTRDYILKLFESLNLVEEKYIYGSELYNTYDSKKGFGTGLYHFKK